MSRLRYRAKDAAIRVGRWIRLAATAAAGAGVVACALGGYSYLTTSERLAVHDVVIAGADPMHTEELEMLTGVHQGDNVLLVDLRLVRDRIEAHPWVERASVTRDLPHRVRIVVKERVPEMILALDELYYVDSNGVPFKPLEIGDSYDFPVLVGLSRSDFEKRPDWVRGTLEDALTLLHLAEHEGALASSEVSEILLGNEGFTLTTVTGDLVVYVGNGQFERKFKRLARVRSVGGTAHARRVDLRFNQRVVVAP